MKLIIAGSRDIEDYFTVKSLIEEAIELNCWHISEVVCGDCPTGIDQLGVKWANENNKLISYFPANWKLHGKAAGPIRNLEMALYADYLCLIHNGSRGSKSMFNSMFFVDKPIHQVSIGRELFD